MSTGLVSRAIAMVGPLIVTPVSLAYLGNQVYGLWSAIAAMIASALFADLGLGSGLMTRLTVALADGEPQTRIIRMIGSAYASLAAIALVMAGASVLLIPAIDWSAIFDGADAVETRTAVGIIMIATVSFFVNIPLSLVHRVQFAAQRSATSNIWQAVGSLMAVSAAIGAISLDLGAWGVVLAASCAVPMANILNSAWFFGSARRDLSPKFRAAHVPTIAELLRLGLGFSVIAALTGMAVSLDPFLVSITLGLDETTVITLATRFLAPVTAVAASIAMPLWTSLGASVAQGDLRWTKRAVYRTSASSFAITAVLGAFLSWVSPQLLGWWLGPSATAIPDPALLFSLTASLSVLAGVMPFLSLESSRSRICNQALGLGAFALLGIPLKLQALQVLGITALGWVGAVTYFLVMAPVCILSVRALSSLEREPRTNPAPV